MPSPGVNDRLFLAVDSTKLPKHVASLGVLRRPKDAGADYVQQLAERFRAAPGGERELGELVSG